MDGNENQDTEIVGFVGDPSTAVGLRWLTPVVRTASGSFTVAEQTIATDRSRLEALAVGRACTLFPDPIGLPSTWSLLLVDKASATAVHNQPSRDQHRIVWLPQSPDVAIVTAPLSHLSELAERLAAQAFAAALSAFEQGELRDSATQLVRASRSRFHTDRVNVWRRILVALQHASVNLDGKTLAVALTDASPITGYTVFWKNDEAEELPAGAEWLNEKAHWACMAHTPSTDTPHLMVSAWERHWRSLVSSLYVHKEAASAARRTVRFWELTQLLLSHNSDAVPPPFLHYEGMRLANIGKKLRQEAQREASRHVLEATALCWSGLIHQVPGEPSNYFQRAQAYESLADAESLERMYKDCRKGLELTQARPTGASRYMAETGVANAHRLLARYYIRKREWTAAIDNFHKAKDLFFQHVNGSGYRYVNERYAQTLYYLGRLDPFAARERNLSQASEIFSELISRNPRFVWGYVQRGDCEFSLGSYAAAESSFRFAKNVRPNDYVGYDRLRSLYSWQCRNDEAVQETIRLCEIAARRNDQIAVQRATMMLGLLRGERIDGLVLEPAVKNLSAELNKLLQMRGQGTPTPDVDRQIEIVNAVDPIAADVDAGSVWVMGN